VNSSCCHFAPLSKVLWQTYYIAIKVASAKRILPILRRGWRFHPFNFRQGWKQPAAVDAQTGKLRDLDLCCIVINVFTPEEAIFAGLYF